MRVGTGLGGASGVWSWRLAADRDMGGEMDVDEDDDNEGEGDIHPSWRIYEQPGNKCVVCYGTGKDKCLFCFGKGSVLIGPEVGRDTEVCPLCEGATFLICERCEGSGVRPATRYDVKLGKYVPNWTNEQISRGEVNLHPSQRKDEQEGSDATGSTEPSPSQQKSNDVSETETGIQV
uniref:Uncharacterized protein n=1 Tax=Compsopogon caeruleus TaxID=31354 RepID=A0A7S1TBT2_9RHOD